MIPRVAVVQIDREAISPEVPDVKMEMSLSRFPDFERDVGSHTVRIRTRTESARSSIILRNVRLLTSLIGLFRAFTGP